jgi:hypothetical protein
MVWAAYTAFALLQSGANIHVVASPHVQGQPLAAPVAGDTLQTYHRGQPSLGTARVLTASAFQVMFELPDGSRWRMTPWTSEDAPVSFSSPALYLGHWVVRDQVRLAWPPPRARLARRPGVDLAAHAIHISKMRRPRGGPHRAG